MSEWKEMRLKDVSSDVSYGYTASAMPDTVGPKFLRITDIQGGAVNWDGVPYCEISEDKIDQYRLEEGDIVVARTGNSTGENYLFRNSKDECVFASYLIRFRIDETKADPVFVWYNMRSPSWSGFVESSKTGSAQAGANATILGNYRFPLPPLPIQRRIADILGTLDAKIELNRRTSATLEQMAQALFKSWFVDFDPVHAKAAGRRISLGPKGLAPALPPEIARLFPKEFEESPLGLIPKGWRVGTLADHITASKGLSYKGDHLCEASEGVPMHNLNSVYEGGGYKHEGLKWYNGEYRPAHILEPGDVIVTNTEQGFDHLLIGYAAIVPKRYGEQGIFSHHIFCIKSKAGSHLQPWFFYLLLRTGRFHQIVAGFSNGTTVNMLPLDGLQKPQIVIPPEEIVRRFGDVFLSMQAKLEKIYDENITLSTLRDALLPKLLSGAVEV